MKRYEHRQELLIESRFYDLSDIDLEKLRNEFAKRVRRKATALQDIREDLSKADRERVKVASQSLLKEVQALLAPLEQWTQKEQTQAEVEVFILDHLYPLLPSPPFTDDDKQAVAREVYGYIWNSSA